MSLVYDRTSSVERLYDGEVLQIDSEATHRLASIALRALERAFSPVHDIRQAQFLMTEQEFGAACQEAGSTIRTHSDTVPTMRCIVEDLGMVSSDVLATLPSVISSPHGGYSKPLPGSAYIAHRETWFGYPPCELNWWIALHDVDMTNSFVIYTEMFRARVANTSTAFDCDAFRQLRASCPDEALQMHPTPLESFSRTPACQVVAHGGTGVVFSGAHLHQTLPNETGYSRFSIVFRTVSIADTCDGRGPPNVDSQARGSPLSRMIPLLTS